MVLRHSMRVMSSRFSLVYKVLLYICIMLLLFSAITYAAVFPVIKPIIDGIDNMNFFEHIGDAFSSIFSGSLEVQSNAFHQLGLDFESISEVFQTNQNNVILGAVLFCLFIFICKFFVTLAKLPACDVLNNFMNSNSRFGFMSNLIANIRKATAYSLVDIFINIPYYVLVGTIVYYVGLVCTVNVSLWLALICGLTIIIVMLAIKSAILSMWLPMYINEEKGVFRSLVDSIKLNKKLILNNFGLFVATFFLIYSLSVCFAIVTFGIGLIFAISISQMIVLSLQLVLYYRVNEKKYYIDPETVVNSKNVVKSVY